MWSPANAGTLLKAIHAQTVAMRIASSSSRNRSHTSAARPDIVAMCVDQRDLVLDDD
jgi:hypothetical protein